jgi:hypothetical protein
MVNNIANGSTMANGSQNVAMIQYQAISIAPEKSSTYNIIVKNKGKDKDISIFILHFLNNTIAGAPIGTPA